jgi:hypothetical protein
MRLFFFGIPAFYGLLSRRARYFRYFSKPSPRFTWTGSNLGDNGNADPSNKKSDPKVAFLSLLYESHYILA